MESIKLETRVLSTPSEKWETLSFKILLNGKTEYVKCKKAPEKAELIDQIQGLKEGDMVSLVINPWINNNTQKTKQKNTKTTQKSLKITKHVMQKRKRNHKSTKTHKTTKKPQT